MTVSVKRNKVQYTGDNSTTAFSVTFPYTETSQVKVYLDSTLQTITTHYTLTDPGATGTVTFLTPPGTGVNVSLIRETDYLQGVDYVNNDALDAETLEKAFDKLTMMAQQLDAKIDASVGFDETVAGTTSLKLASDATDLAGKLLAFDDSGNFVTTQEIGTFKGSDTTTTTAAYVVRDLIRDSSNDNVYFTKVDAPSGTLLTNTSYFELLVDVATVRQLKVDAETAKTDAETAQTGAEAALASFQGQYKSAAANPYGGAEDVGDLWYDETANILKYYTGSAFEPVTTSLATVTDNYLTISNQVITAGTVPVSLGGTGATTASGARTALGVDAAGTDNSTDVTLAGSLDYLTISGQAITRNAIDLTTDVTGALPVANGGTGATSASAARTALGLGSAATSNTSAFEASGAVSTHAAVTSSVHGISAFGATLVDDADAATARTTLGLGTAATTAASAYATAAQGTTADSALQDVVDDTTPQLGGDLDVNGNSIVSASNGNIAITPNGTGNVSLGNFTFDADQTVGAGQDNYVLTYDHSTTSISLEAAAGGGGGGVSDGDKGDITVSGSGATWTIDSAAVTYAKIQNVSATDKLLGRSTAGAGSIEEISCTSAGRALLDDADSAAQRTTLGLGTAALSASGDFETAGAVSTHAALTSSVHGISSFGATLVDDADASAARTTLGLGTISTQASDSVSITGGSVTGITDLAIADGGTGASTASVARGNLLPSYSGNGSKVLALNSGGTDVEWVTQSQVFTAGVANAFEHANSISDNITVASGNNRLYMGDTTFSGTLTIEGKLVSIDGPFNLTGTANITGTLSVRH